jgi:hypothetical protein
MAREDPTEAKEIAEHAMEIDSSTDLDAIDALTLIMKLGQYLAQNPGVVKDD